MNKPLVTWTSPIHLDKLEGLALALCVRLCATKRKLSSGEIEMKISAKRFDPLPSTLTKERIEDVLVSFAYLRHKIRTDAFILEEEDLLQMIAGLKEEEVSGWTEDHPKQIEQARKDLRALAAGDGSIGFRCHG